jgi:hypothetical protein
MKEANIEQLFKAARNQRVPEPPFSFTQNVISAIRREERSRVAPRIFDQLGSLFPRLAWAAVLIIALCLGSDFYFSQKDSGITAEVQQVAEQWLFAAK